MIWRKNQNFSLLHNKVGKLIQDDRQCKIHPAHTMSKKLLSVSLVNEVNISFSIWFCGINRIPKNAQGTFFLLLEQISLKIFT